ncbi:MAG: endonuclease III domain-containing protein [Planctomycetota bacterium]
MRRRLQGVYDRLFAHFGPQHWWPGETPFEILVGAILTQNTAWTNVERAIANLQAAGVLAAEALLALPEARLAELIRPSGYYNLKARRLRACVQWFVERHGADPARLAAAPYPAVRADLLGVRGVGPETADSILLYAAGRPTFVVDAYTRRSFSRLGLVPPDVDYEALRALFLDHLPVDVACFNEYHALLVALGKHLCRPRAPRCADCPLRRSCRGPAAAPA